MPWGSRVLLSIPVAIGALTSSCKSFTPSKLPTLLCSEACTITLGSGQGKRENHRVVNGENGTSELLYRLSGRGCLTVPGLSYCQLNSMLTSSKMWVRTDFSSEYNM